MSKVLFASLLMAFAWVGVHAEAQPQLAWVCTYHPTSVNATDANILQAIPGLRDVLQINLGPQETFSRGTMECASPLFPTSFRYENVLVKAKTFVAGANVGNPPCLSQVSFQVNAGVSAHPRHMFRKYAIQASGNANLLLVRVGADGAVNAGPGQLSASGALNVSPALFAVGGDAAIGTIEIINLNSEMRKISRLK